jgi:hypothetical protein
MQALQIATLADHVKNLPPAGAGRDRRLNRLTDLYARTEALTALQSAAGRAREGVLATAFASAAALLDAGLGADAVFADDSAALDRLRAAATSPELLSLVPAWIHELREIAAERPDSGACTLATAIELWVWTMDHFCTGEGARTPSSSRAIDDLAEALSPLLAARSFTLDVARGTAAASQLQSDLCHVHAARAAAATGAACAELVFGYRRHLTWDAEGCRSCFTADQLDDLEALIPGIASGTRSNEDVVEADGSHPSKRGPCASFEGMETFMRLRRRLDGCLTGAATARDRASAALEHSVTTMHTEGKA